MRSRSRIAAAVLPLFLLLHASMGERLFSRPRLALFDAFMRLAPRERRAAPVVIVTVDDASLRALGQWPWPRRRMAQLVTKVLAAHPLAVGVDVVWPEPDRLSPARWMQQVGPLPTALGRELLALPDHDDLLGAALAGGPVAIGVVGLRGEAMEDRGPLAPVRVLGGASERALAELLPRFDALLRSIPQLDRGAPAHGLLSADRDADGVIRRMPLVASVGVRTAPALATEMLRLAAGSAWIDVRVRDGRVHGVGVGAVEVPSQADGSVWLHLSPHDPARFVSAADVLADKVPADLFERRLVLLAVTGLGLTDLQITPLGPMVGSEIHAQLLESLLGDGPAVRPAWARVAELALCAAAGLLLILALPRLRLRWYAPIALLLLTGLGAIGFGAWLRAQWLIDTATPALGASALFVALLGGRLADSDARRKLLQGELARERVAAAKREGELAAAARIQMGMLPRPHDLASDPRFDLAAVLIPAQQVGGDLYDFFKLDEHRLFLAIGDVSGKGLPASLFMALGKTLCKSCALRGGRDVGEIVRWAERELSRENPEMMFVTLFAGILDLRSGELQFCSAGHEAPFVVRGDGQTRQLDAIGGPPLCAVDEFDYRTESHQLSAGELLCLVTDGITEAVDPGGNLFGRARASAALNGLPASASSHGAIAGLRESVASFMRGAAPADDIALLAVRWTPRSVDLARYASEPP